MLERVRACTLTLHGSREAHVVDDQVQHRVAGPATEAHVREVLDHGDELVDDVDAEEQHVLHGAVTVADLADGSQDVQLHRRMAVVEQARHQVGHHVEQHLRHLEAACNGTTV